MSANLIVPNDSPMGKQPNSNRINQLLNQIRINITLIFQLQSTLAQALATPQTAGGISRLIDRIEDSGLTTYLEIEATEVRALLTWQEGSETDNA